MTIDYDIVTDEFVITVRKELLLRAMDIRHTKHPRIVIGRMLVGIRGDLEQAVDEVCAMIRGE